jgi:hypothetical protein
VTHVATTWNMADKKSRDTLHNERRRNIKRRDQSSVDLRREYMLSRQAITEQTDGIRLVQSSKKVCEPVSTGR